MKDGRYIVKEYRNADIFATVDIQVDTDFGFAKINIQFDPDASEQAQSDFRKCFLLLPSKAAPPVVLSTL